MSVVNQMLKDLEQRQADEQGVSAVYQPSAKPKGVPFSWIIIIVLVVLLAGILGWMMMSQPEQAVVPEQDVPEQMPAQITTAKPMTVKAPVEEQQKAVVDTPDESSQVTTQSEVVDAQDEVVATISSEATNNSDAVEAVARQTVAEETSQPVEMRVVAAADTTPEVQAPSSFSKQSAAPENDSSSLRDKALAAVRSGQDDVAIQLLEQLVAQEPTNTAARKKLAALLFAQGQATRARIVLDAGIQLYPQDASMRLMLARLLEQQQQVAAAFAVLNPDVSLSSINAEFLGVRAAMADQLGEYATAFDDYLRLTQLQPEQARWWLGLAIASERVNASAQALMAYQQAASMNQLSRDVQRFVQQRISLLVGNQ